jgi:hypothetical protein
MTKVKNVNRTCPYNKCSLPTIQWTPAHQKNFHTDLSVSQAFPGWRVTFNRDDGKFVCVCYESFCDLKAFKTHLEQAAAAAAANAAQTVDCCIFRFVSARLEEGTNVNTSYMKVRDLTVRKDLDNTAQAQLNTIAVNVNRHSEFENLLIPVLEEIKNSFGDQKQELRRHDAELKKHGVELANIDADLDNHAESISKHETAISELKKDFNNIIRQFGRQAAQVHPVSSHDNRIDMMDPD